MAMRIGMVGLGKMGANMTTRLLRGGHEVVVNDHHEEAMRAAEQNGATSARSLEAVVAALGAPGERAVWVMVPAGEPTESTIASLATLLARGDVVIDGGNSNYKETMRRAAMLKERGILMVD